MNNTNPPPQPTPEEILIETIFYHAWSIASRSNIHLLKNLHKRFGSFEIAWKQASCQLLSTLSPETDIVTRKQKTDPRKEWEKFSTSPIRLIMLDHPDYPPLLKQLAVPPFGLYVQGIYAQNLTQLLTSHTPLSVVGTRRPSPYGIIQTQRIIQSLAHTKTIIISGLALGIDTIAHETALLENLPTIAIIGHGHNAFAATRQSLANLIAESGAIISEYAPDVAAQHYHFPQRNRIIAGLATTTLVTEAPIRSGALITAHIAFEADREVLALTADIDRTDCAGNLYLIENHTATPLTSYNMLTTTPQTNQQSQTQLELTSTPEPPDHSDSAKILRLLTYKKSTPLSHLADQLNFTQDIQLLLQQLTLLEIDGYITQTAQGYIKIAN